VSWLYPTRASTKTTFLVLEPAYSTFQEIPEYLIVSCLDAFADVKNQVDEFDYADQEPKH
jgi:hypothetical protein